ncbi:MAG: histidine kinase [Mogibacterium sp.]|nr:histidine kinase [Mogibacterium sp.]
MALFGSKKSADVANTSNIGEAEMLRRDYGLAKNRLKPHFVNNILSSIYYLCESDPQRAQKVSMDFSSYMMNIIERLDTHGLAPFSKELDLIKAYISIEDLRLENKLKSDYDIYISDFEVPPMSLEPLVEIAVKHNIAAKPEGGMVTIATRRLAEEGVQIKISDNGVGFDPADPDFDQTDLQNVRSRLKSELGAELTVNSAPGQDTEFTIVFYPNK